MNFTLESEDLDLFYLYIKGSDFYELWQQHKQLKTMKTNETWLDIYNERYIHQLQPGPTQKIQYHQHKQQVQRYPHMEHLSNYHEDRLNQHLKMH